MPPKYFVNGKDMRVQVYINGRYVYPTHFESTHTVIAYRFQDQRVACVKCALQFDLDAIAIYPINIIPYSQNCHLCARTLILGWNCQLFDNPDGEK